MNHVFHPEASDEFLRAIDSYEANEPGLGEQCYCEIMAAVGRIAQGPRTWPVLEGDVRRCLTHRFPYGVLYSVEVDAIFIVAVMHLHQRPNYWRDRVM